MDSAIEKILREFEKRSEQEAEQVRQMDMGKLERHLDEFLLSVGPAVGQLINLLVKETEAKSILEVGSSYGYSTVWLAEAARTTGGNVISLEIQQEKQRYARAAIEKAGLGGFVDFRLGDARDSLRALETTVDFVLLDLWKHLY